MVQPPNFRWCQGQYFTAGTSGILSGILRRRCIWPGRVFVRSRP